MYILEQTVKLGTIFPPALTPSFCHSAHIINALAKRPETTVTDQILAVELHPLYLILCNLTPLKQFGLTILVFALTLPATNRIRAFDVGFKQPKMVENPKRIT